MKSDSMLSLIIVNGFFDSNAASVQPGVCGAKGNILCLSNGFQGKFIVVEHPQGGTLRLWKTV